jgi:hypothetical protein
MNPKLAELTSELKTVFSGKGGRILDTILPLLLFVILNQIATFAWALALTLGLAVVLTVIRLVQRQTVGYALAGLGSVGLAALLATLSGSQTAYFLPGLVSGGLTIAACVVSILLRRPLAAWSSHITRGWPLPWYWHARVRPAYSEVTAFWAIAFGLRLALEYILFRQADLTALGVIRLLMGWPYTILVLVISYLYGLWRLRKLQGPSVEEFNNQAAPPWQGQQRGF